MHQRLQCKWSCVVPVDDSDHLWQQHCKHDRLKLWHQFPDDIAEYDHDPNHLSYNLVIAYNICNDHYGGAV